MAITLIVIIFFVKSIMIIRVGGGGLDMFNAGYDGRNRETWQWDCNAKKRC